MTDQVFYLSVNKKYHIYKYVIKPETPVRRQGFSMEGFSENPSPRKAGKKGSEEKL